MSIRIPKYVTIDDMSRFDKHICFYEEGEFRFCGNCHSAGFYRDVESVIYDDFSHFLSLKIQSEFMDRIQQKKFHIDWFTESVLVLKHAVYLFDEERFNWRYCRAALIKLRPELISREVRVTQNLQHNPEVFSCINEISELENSTPPKFTRFFNPVLFEKWDTELGIFVMMETPQFFDPDKFDWERASCVIARNAPHLIDFSKFNWLKGLPHLIDWDDLRILKLSGKDWERAVSELVELPRYNLFLLEYLPKDISNRIMERRELA